MTQMKWQYYNNNSNGAKIKITSMLQQYCGHNNDGTTIWQHDDITMPAMEVLQQWQLQCRQNNDSNCNGTLIPTTTK
jgi:hypothetical protein